MRVYLIGFMAAGKTTVGEILAGRLGVPFVDLDSQVERTAAKSVREIFASEGEPAFRAREAEALRDTLRFPAVVVATGGGTLLVDANRALIRDHGLSVFLNPPFATIAGRIAAHGKVDRPLFRSETEALELYRARLPMYRRADATVEVGAAESAAEVAARVALLVERLRCAT